MRAFLWGRGGYVGRSGVGAEAVAEAAYRLDPALADLAADRSDEDLDDVGRRVVSVAPHPVEDLLAGEHIAGVKHEKFHDRELARRQVGDEVLARQPPVADVEHQAAGFDGVTGRLARRLTVLDPQLDPGEQLGELERLGHVVVGTAFQPGDPVVDGIAGGEDDDGYVVGLRTQSLQYVETGQSRQADVQDDQVEGSGPGQQQRGLTVVRDRRQVTGGAQPLLDERRDPV